jgi:serine/threonine protein kinase
MGDLIHTTLKEQYFLRRIIGSGGSGDVYQAFDRKRDTNMAVKVIRQDLADDNHLIKLFEQEAAILKKLSHPNIVRLYEFDKQDRIAFFVMDFIEGSDLRQAITKKQQPFTLEEVKKILDPICKALTFAHNEQYYHCDIKSANILLHVDGRVFLGDFGVARRVHEQKQGGTPTYEAPEQIRGGRIDARTDIYGLGVVIYEMLSGGILPFRGDSPSSNDKTTLKERIKWEHLNLPPEPLYKLNPSLPKEVEAVVEKALSKEPDSRYPSVMALQQAFENACLIGAVPDQSDKVPDRSGDTIMGPQPPLTPNLSPQAPKQPPALVPAGKVHGPHLFGRSGEFAGRVIPLSQTSTTLGRGKGNQLHLQEASVSRSQATLLKTRHGVFIRDEQSSLGTFVNGKRISAGMPVPLHSGDVIRVGYYQELEFREK